MDNQAELISRQREVLNLTWARLAGENVLVNMQAQAESRGEVSRNT